MGTDIHLYVERRSPTSAWELVPEPDGWDDWYSGRNSEEFEILGNVRNDHSEDEPFPAISDWRWVPQDASAKFVADRDELEGFAASWVTLRELLDYPWQTRRVRSGYVDAVHFGQWKAQRIPEQYSDITFCDIVDHATMQQRIADGTADADLRTEVQWELTAAQAAPYLHGRLLPVLRKLGPPDDVRLLFYFCN